MKNRVLFFLVAIILVSSCKKQEVINNETDLVVKTQKQFYFQGSWYLLNYEDGIPVDPETKSFIDSLFSNNENLIVDHIAGETEKVYITEEETEFYDLFPEKLIDGVSKKMMVNIAINKLKEDLTVEFGDVFDNRDNDFIVKLETEITKICEKHDFELPSKFSNFFKSEEFHNPTQASQRGWDICEVWEGTYFGGEAIPVNPFDFGTSNTYGDWGCFQDIKVSDLSNVPMVNGIQSHWDNAISSGYFKVNEGADATVFWCYKKTNFKGYKERFNTSNVSYYTGGNSGNGTTYTVSTFNDHHWCWLCKSLNDSISSMKATNIWEGC